MTISLQTLVLNLWQVHVNSL